MDDWFWNSLDRSGECWLWAHRTDEDGYGRLSLDGQGWRAHRFAWMLANGPIPDGMSILHHCDTPACCNPEHLFLGTQADNMKDRARKHRWDGLHGEQHPHAKLTREAVDQIRTLYRQGSITQTALGEYFGVHQVTISAIVRGRTWR